MKTSIKLLLLDDDPSAAIAQIEDHLRDQVQAVAESIAYPNNGFVCVIPARGLLPEILLSMEANAPEITQPDVALAWASSRLNEQSFNGILIDDSWDNDSDDRSGHELILIGLSKLPSLLAMHHAQLAIFSGHLENDHQPGSRNIAVASKIEAALPSGLKARFRPIPKSKSEMFGSWFQHLVLNRPPQVADIQVFASRQFEIQINGVTQPLTEARYMILGYLDLAANGKAGVAREDLAKQIKKLATTETAVGKEIVRLVDSARQGATFDFSVQDMSKALLRLKEAVIPFLDESRRTELCIVAAKKGLFAKSLCCFLKVVIVE